eukprot:703535-Pelagomonas_calceolata.AAC.1
MAYDWSLWMIKHMWMQVAAHAHLSNAAGFCKGRVGAVAHGALNVKLSVWEGLGTPKIDDVKSHLLRTNKVSGW